MWNLVLGEGEKKVGDIMKVEGRGVTKGVGRARGGNVE